MMPRLRIEISRRLIRSIHVFVLVRTVDVAVTGGIAPVRPIALMRGERRGVEARQDKRKKAAKEDQRTHCHPSA